MAGLMTQMQKPEASAPPARMQRGATDPMNTDGQAATASPEEQQQYDAFVGNAYKLMFGDDNRMRSIIASLKASDDPKMNLANATAQVVMALQQSAAKAGQQIGPDVLMHGGAEIMETLAEAAQRAKIHDYTADEMEGAWYQAVDMYREMASKAGLVDPEKAKAEFANLQQQDQSGALAEQLRGFADAAPEEEAPAEIDDQEETE